MNYNFYQYKDVGVMKPVKRGYVWAVKKNV